MAELLTRGVERIYPSLDELEKVLASGKKLKIYFGIDPTGPALHIGHLANLLRLRDFQDQGHEITILIGDFTAMIGDPTDKTAARIKLTSDQVAENLKNYRSQIEKILSPEKTKFVFNSSWLAGLNFGAILELASEFTVSQLLERDMFQERLRREQPVYLHEFLYPLMQGYDSVVLGVDLEIGGNDQTFNMLAGRQMQKRRGQEKFVLAGKLLVDGAGKKMGKTEGNMVMLSDQPSEIFGKVMSWPDELLPLGFELCTRLPMADQSALIADNPKLAKMQLAREIISLLYGSAEAQLAEEHFVNTFQKKEIPESIEEIVIESGELLGDALVRAGIVASKSEFRRLVEQGGIHDLDGSVIIDPLLPATSDLRLRVGKRRFVKLVAQ